MAAGDAGKTSLTVTSFLCTGIHAHGSASKKNLIVGPDDPSGAKHGPVCVVDVTRAGSQLSWWCGDEGADA